MRAGECWHRPAGLVAIYLTKNLSGRKPSPLDVICQTTWTFSVKLAKLPSIIEHFSEAEARAGELLSQVIEGRLIAASAIPTPTDD